MEASELLTRDTKACWRSDTAVGSAERRFTRHLAVVSYRGSKACSGEEAELDPLLISQSTSLGTVC